MKKTLIAAAVVGAFAGAAQAQTNVTLYGVADVGLRWDRTTSGSYTSMTGGELAGSRWGLRGSEDLGGGMRANFMIEAGFNVDAGTTVSAAAPVAIFNRTSYAGLSGNWGNFRLGNDYSPYLNTWSKLDPFGPASISAMGTKAVPGGASSSLVLPSYSAGAYVGGATRMTNTIFYDTPEFSGFRVLGAYKFGEAVPTAAGVPPADKALGNAYSLAGIYANGPIFAGIANYQAKTAVGITKKDLVWGGSYDFRVAKVALQVFTEKDNTAGAGQRNTRSTELGVTVPVGALIVKASYARYDDRNALTNADATATNLGVDYVMSKRTTLYGRWARIHNNANAAMGLSGGMLGTGTIGLGSSPSAITAGINHKF